MGKHLRPLDGLRGLAIAAVVCCHVNIFFGGPFAAGTTSAVLARVLGGGWVGVNLFFVLSGFLITGILWDAKGGERYFLNFYARRALRILPLYYGWLILMLVVLPWLSSDPIAPEYASSYWLFYSNILMSFTHRQSGGLGIYWSLAVEEHFYLVWPVVVSLLSRRLLMMICVVVSACSLLTRVAFVAEKMPDAAFFFTICQFDALLAGAFVALAWRGESDWRLLRRAAPFLAGGAAFVIAALALTQQHFVNFGGFRGFEAYDVDSGLVLTIGVSAVAVFSAGALVLAVDPESGLMWKKFLEIRPLHVLGKYSYAVYVFHIVVIIWVVQLFGFLGAREQPDYFTKPATVVVSLLLSLAAAWLSYHLFEKHFLRLKRFFAS